MTSVQRQKNELKEDHDFREELKDDIMVDCEEYIEKEVTERVAKQVAPRLEEAKRSKQ